MTTFLKNYEKTNKLKLINLSNKKLSQHEIRFLENGLKFTPTPKPNQVELVNDKKFCWKLQLKEFFSNIGYMDDCLVKTQWDSNSSLTETGTRKNT